MVFWYLLWNLFSIARGLFIAETYWDWKGLIENSLTLLLPIIVFTSSNPETTQSILAYYIKYALPLFIAFAFFITTDAYGFYLAPIGFILLFLPLLTKKWKAIVLFFTLIVLLSDLGARSNIIKFIIPILLLSIFYMRFFISKKLIEFIRKFLILTPAIFFTLAIYGLFNIFKLDEYIKSDYTETRRDAKGEISEDKLTADTRSFLYLEVLQSAYKYNSWWIGRSPARGYESNAFGSDDMSGRGERSSNEVGILNVFTWTGIIGVFLYFLVFYQASFLAVNRSSNIFSQILGLFIAFRWAYAWVEDTNVFNLNYFMLWLMIGLGFSKSFREMTNEEIRKWARGIFDKRYRQTIPVVNN